MPETEENRRSRPRWGASFPVQYGKAKEGLLRGEAADISAEGLGFVAEYPLPQGRNIEVRFRIAPGASLIICPSAIVRHSEGNRAGVEFLELAVLDRLQIWNHYREGQAPSNRTTK